MKTAITKLFPIQVNTKYGPKEKFDVYIEVDSREFRFNVWKNAWNQNWQIGTIIEVPTLNDKRWQKSEFKGKTYYQLSAPNDASSYSQNQQQELPQQDTELSKRIDKLEEEVTELKLKVMENEIEKEKEAIPIVSDETPIEEIPF